MIPIDRMEMRSNIINVRSKTLKEFCVFDFMRFYKLVELLLKGWVVHGY